MSAFVPADHRWFVNAFGLVTLAELIASLDIFGIDR
jgi:hypothetical protein